MAVPSAALQRIIREKAIFDKNAASFPFKLEADEKDAFKWTIAFTAPPTYTASGASRPSPWAGRALRVSVVLSAQYPMKAPDVNFPPHSMWHPNVDFDSGEVCAIRTLFGPTMMLKDIGNILHEFMLVPSLTTPTNVEAAGEMCNEVAKFEANARSKLAAAA